MTTEGDIVLIYHKEQPGVYARIEKILPDIKKDWYHVTLTMLTIPHQVITWILRDEYINGAPFTMGGESIKLVLLERLKTENHGEKDENNTPDKKKKNETKGKVISFDKNKKK